MPRSAELAALAFAAAAVTLTVAPTRADANRPAPSEDSTDVVELARIAVPSSERRQGEVRVLRRGDAAVVQTVLHSTILRQVLGRIAEKEQRNWGASEVGGDDSRAYVAALRDVLPELEPTGQEATGSDRFRSLVIEFVLTPTDDLVELAAPVVDEASDGRLRVSSVRSLRTLDLGRPYVRANMARIIEDSFDIDLDAAGEMVRRAEGDDGTSGSSSER